MDQDEGLVGELQAPSTHLRPNVPLPVGGEKPTFPAEDDDEDDDESEEPFEGFSDD